MKKIIIISFFIALSSCSKKKEEVIIKNAEQIKVAKKELLKMNVKDFELEKYQFKVVEAFDKDVYKMAQKKYDENAERDRMLGDYGEARKELKKIEEYLILESKATGKIFYRVQAYRIVGDTLRNKIIFIDNNNKVIDFHNIK